MQVSNQQEKSKKYNLANAKTRIIARIVDMILALLVSFCLFCVIFLTDPACKGSFFNTYPSEPYRFLIYGIFSTIWYFCYFIVIPYYWKGRTLAKKNFKLATYNLVYSHFFWNLIKKEVLIWMLFDLINLCLLITIFIIGTINQDDIKEILKSLTFANNDSTKFKNIPAIFISLYSTAGIILLCIAFSVCLHSNKQAFHDKISNTVVVKTIDSNSNDKNDILNKKKTMKKRNYALPGIILDSAHDTIGSLDE